MAKAMTAAAAVPHFYYVEEIEVDKLTKLKRALSEGVPLEPGVKLTHLPFLIKSLSMALKKYPVMNSTVDEAVTEIQVRGMLHMSWFLLPAYIEIISSIFWFVEFSACLPLCFGFYISTAVLDRIWFHSGLWFWFVFSLCNYFHWFYRILTFEILKFPFPHAVVDDTVAASHNIGVAMATSHGLAVPNIKNVQRLSVLQVGYLDLRLPFVQFLQLVRLVSFGLGFERY